MTREDIQRMAQDRSISGEEWDRLFDAWVAEEVRAAPPFGDSLANQGLHLCDASETDARRLP